MVKIETEKYFRFLLDTVTEGGGTVELGVSLTAKSVEEMKQKGHVVNCLGASISSCSLVDSQFLQYCMMDVLCTG